MANLIRLKQIESGSSLGTAAQVGQDFSQSVINIITSEVAAALPDGVISSSAQVYITGTIGYNDIATDLEVAVISSSISASQVLISSSISSSIAATLSGSALSVTNLSASVSTSLSLISASIAATDLAISSSISSSNYNLSSSVSTSLSLLSSSIQSVTGDFSASVARTFATQSSNITSVSSSLNAFTSSIGLTIKAKMDTENVITSSRQLDGSVINNLTLGTTGDNYSLIVSGALAVVDADIIISGTQYNVGGEIWVNGQTGSAGNPPVQPYDNSGQPQSDIIDQGEW